MALFFFFLFLSGIISTLCEKTWVIFVSRTFVVYREFSFFFKIYFCSCFSYIDTKEMGNRDVVKVNVEIKFWLKSYYLLILVLRWKILYLILDNDLLLSRNQVFCFKKNKTCRSSNSRRIHCFSLKFCACVVLAMFKYFLFCSVVLMKNLKIFLEARRSQVFLLFSWYLRNEGSKIPACTCRYFHGKQMYETFKEK